MKLLKKTQLKISILLAALLFAVTLFTGWNFSYARAEDEDEFVEYTYIPTQVEALLPQQAETCVRFGFKLTVSDYTEGFESDFGGTEYYKTFEEYIVLDCSYWSGFATRNSKGDAGRLDQLYAYFNGGKDPNTGEPSVGTTYANALVHRSALKRLEVGFMVWFPSGTTFPSETYVKSNFTTEPTMYITTEDVAFYFNGTTFEKIDYSIAMARADAENKLNNVKYSDYKDAEIVTVKGIVENTRKSLQLCKSVFAIQDAMSAFDAAISKVMTKNDYKALATAKTLAKEEINAYFATISSDDYDQEELDKINALKTESAELIDSAMNVSQIDGIIVGIKHSVGILLTKDQKADFATYRSSAAANLENCFNPSVYRDAEKAQGQALVEEGVALINSATTYAQVDAVENEYIARIAQLKTSAELDEEEKNQQEQEKESESAVESTPNVFVEPVEDSSWIFIIIGGAVALLAAAAVVVVIIIIKKKKGANNED